MNIIIALSVPQEERVAAAEEAKSCFFCFFVDVSYCC